MNKLDFTNFGFYNKLSKELLQTGGVLLQQIHDKLAKHPDCLTILQLTEHSLQFETVGQVFTIRIKIIPELLVANKNAFLETYYEDPANDYKEKELLGVHAYFDRLGNIGNGDVNDFCKYYSFTLPDAWLKLNLPVIYK